MKWLARIAVLLVAACGASGTARPAAVPTVAAADLPLARIQAMIGKHCIDCHDKSNKSLDLTRPLVVGDARTERMLSAVSSYRMPPPTKSVESKSDIINLYPMTEPERAQLGDDLERLLEAAPGGDQSTPSYSEDERFQSMIAVAAPLVPDAEIRKQIAPLNARGLGSGFGNDGPSPHSIVKLRMLAYGLCRSMVRELDKKTSDAAGTEAHVKALLEALYGDAPTDAALAENIAMLNGFAGLVDPPDTPLVALCTTHLSGPRFGYAVITHPPPKHVK